MVKSTLMAEILIVEDDPDLVETYTDLMESRGHSVIYASRLSQALEQLSKHSPQIITLDLNLPGSSGSNMAEFIHKIKALSSSKIIVISGHPEIISGVDWLEDIDLVLSKPVDNHHLMMMIDRLLSQR
jgi:DNA-binding response OmpR family regulator